MLYGIPIPVGGMLKVVGAGVRWGTAALRAADLGLSGVGITKLVGTVTNAGTTRLIHVGMIEGELGNQLLGALPRMLSSAQAEGVQVLQITANLANDRLAPLVMRLVERAGGTFTSANGGEVITFILR